MFPSLRRVKVKVTATSQLKTASSAADGRSDTRWLCDKSDANPELTLDLTPPVLARQIWISQAGARAADTARFDRITVVEVSINNSKPPLRVELDPDPLAVTKFTLPKVRKIRRLTLRIVDRNPGRSRGQAGFSEIALTK